MSLYRKHPLFVLSIALFAFSFIIRFCVKDLSNLDTLKIGRWYAYLYNNGWNQLADGNFSNYPPAYLYLLWISTFLDDVTGRLVAIKIIPTLFDIFSTFFIFQTARLRYETGDMPYLFSAIFFCLPTVILNSTGWGQVDGCFTSFLILCVYLLLKEKPFWAMTAFGGAFAFKAQSIFLLPFLGILFLKEKIRWRHFFIIPAVYLISATPTMLTGRSWVNILAIYFEQAGQFHKLSFNAPNLYIFVSNGFYETGALIGLFIFFVGMTAWGWLNWRANYPLSHCNVILAAFASLAFVPFLLPKMHERYFYPADVFSFINAIFLPEMWPIAILHQISSGISYSVFLAGAPVVFVMIGALLNTFSVIHILKKQTGIFHESGIQET